MVPDTASLPSFQWWDSREDLLSLLQVHAAVEGYRFIIRRSKLECGRQSLIYACSRWRAGCQLSILIKEKKYGNWEYEYRSEARFSQHNHRLQPTQRPEDKPQEERETGPLDEARPEDEPANEATDGLADVLEDNAEDKPQYKQQLPGKMQPTCSKCHVKGHKRGAKCCPLRGRSSP